MAGLSQALEAYGALPSQVLELTRESARALRYVDLVRAPPAGGAPAVVEVQGRAHAYVFDGRAQPADDVRVASWIRRIAFRGDTDWVGVLRPGRLDIYRASLDGQDRPVPADVEQGPLLLPWLDFGARPARAPRHVRVALLELLSQSIEQTKALKLSANDALSAVGRALFWRFLIDRGLLAGLEPASVCPGAESWAECISTKKAALATFRWLDVTFNGGLLPLETAPSSWSAEVFRGPIGNIAHAASATGQLGLRLPSAWRDVDFAEVPVGLLSEVYEAFAHTEDLASARAESVFYTPRVIAELVVDETLASLEDVARPRVLDPAAGAGVFLVAAFRALVARQWSREGRAPSRAAIRRIMNEQLVGYDINPAALRLAELALYLTAIELDPERRPRPLGLLHFEPLAGRVLVHKAGGAGLGSLGPVDAGASGKFDAVIGNPPWTAGTNREAKSTWLEASRRVVIERLGPERAREFAFPDMNPDLPFVYRAMEWAKPGGCISLVTHARWLFSQTEPGKRARKDLLESVHVTGVLNGAALRETSVWPNVRHAFAVLFARNEIPPSGAAFMFVSPELDHSPARRQTQLRIDWRDAQDIGVLEVIERPWALKSRYVGTPFDDQVLRHLQAGDVTLGAYLAELGVALVNGYQVGGASGAQKSAKALRGLADLKGVKAGYFVDADSLPRFTRPTLLWPRRRENYLGPLLLVHESMTVGDQPRASVCRADVAYDERFDGVSFAGVADGLEIARYLQLVLQSSLTRHALFLLDAQCGVEREVVHKETFAALPIRTWASLSRPQRQRALALSTRLEEAGGGLQHEIDAFVFDVFGLSNVHRDAVRDTLETSFPNAEARKRALSPTTSAERQRFEAVCAASLDGLLAASGARAAVHERPCHAGRWRVLQVDVWPIGVGPPEPVDVDVAQLLRAADGAAVSLVTVVVDATRTLVAVLDSYRYWTPTRARMLAALVASLDGRAPEATDG